MKTLRGERFDSKVSKGINIMYITTTLPSDVWGGRKTMTRANTFEEGVTLCQRVPGIGREFTRMP